MFDKSHSILIKINVISYLENNRGFTLQLEKIVIIC